MYVEGKIVSRSVAIVFMFLNWAWGATVPSPWCHLQTSENLGLIGSAGWIKMTQAHLAGRTPSPTHGLCSASKHHYAAKDLCILLTFPLAKLQKVMLQTRTLLNRIYQSCHSIHLPFHFPTQFSSQHWFVNNALKCQECCVNGGKPAY